jgi:hypothetical protein
MTVSKKGAIYKFINITAITTVVMMIITIYGYLYSKQNSLQAELYSVKDDVTILKQTPIINQIINNTELIKAQRKQIDINTKTLAVLDSQYKDINAKLDLIYSMVCDNNNKLYQHIENSHK